MCIRTTVAPKALKTFQKHSDISASLNIDIRKYVFVFHYCICCGSCSFSIDIFSSFFKARFFRNILLTAINSPVVDRIQIFFYQFGISNSSILIPGTSYQECSISDTKYLNTYSRHSALTFQICFTISD